MVSYIYTIEYLMSPANANKTDSKADAEKTWRIANYNPIL